MQGIPFAHGIGHDLSSFTIRPRAGMHGRPDVPCSSRGLGVCQGSTISWTKSADLRAVHCGMNVTRTVR